MSAIEKRLANLEESLAPALPQRLVFANSKSHADQIAAEDDSECARNPGVARRPLMIIRWLESKEASAKAADYHDPAAVENSKGWQQ